MRKLSQITGTLAALAYSLTRVPSVFAQEAINLQPPGAFSNLGEITYVSLISGAISILLVVAALVFFFMLVIGGIQWILSGGDKTASENARKRITSALIGLAIVFIAWAIITLINALFGVNILSLNFQTFQP